MEPKPPSKKKAKRKTSKRPIEKQIQPPVDNGGVNLVWTMAGLKFKVNLKNIGKLFS